ncbi:MAG TPA: enoyl-CoA hydratase/isomerase family protein, partial [Thermodesulfovibrionales bacterium]|nr:enoyl-CoA hydratase/isomerase family protein [Thermodesulfovibrionales bacterium]
MNTTDYLRVNKEGEIAVITFIRPQVMNIIGTEMLMRLEESLAALEDDGQIGAIVIRGTTHFSAGADIKELKGKDPVAA